MAEAGQPSKVEVLKIASEYLRGPLPDEVAEQSTHITEEASSILKFHGSYQQDDRDVRVKNKREGKEKAYSFMVRTRVPGGKITARQYLVEDDLATTYGNGTLRITTRQEFQLHGVAKGNLKATIGAINRALLSTLAACGDVERNVLSCSAPIKDGIREAMQRDCRTFVSHFAPRTSAYWDIWVDGERIADPDYPTPGPALVPTDRDTEVEPIYGQAYMQRKFKTAFALPYDNCTDIHSNDLGFLGLVENGELVGYNVLVGGGMGTTPSARKTFPALAQPLCSIAREDFLRVAEAIVKVTRDFAERSDRKRSRLKYLLYDWGLPAFKAKVEEYLGRPLAEPKDVEVSEICDHLGWEPQGDGKLSLGLPVENGRIKDSGSLRLMSGLRAFFQKYGTPARLTCQQSVLLIDLEPAWKGEIEAWLQEYGIATVEQTSTVRRWAMACPALPTCGLAVTESERVMPALLDELEAELARLGLEDERISVRMTGCPNGCARPYNCDIGLVGRAASKTGEGGNEAGKYTIFLGGRSQGDRLNVLFKDYVRFDQIVAELSPVLSRFQIERLDGESFGDFCHRLGVEALSETVEAV